MQGIRRHRVCLSALNLGFAHHLHTITSLVIFAITIHSDLTSKSHSICLYSGLKICRLITSSFSLTIFSKSGTRASSSAYTHPHYRNTSKLSKTPDNTVGSESKSTLRSCSRATRCLASAALIPDLRSANARFVLWRMCTPSRAPSAMLGVPVGMESVHERCAYGR